MQTWFNALMPKEERFFDLFSRHAESLQAGATTLRSMMDGGPETAALCARISAHEQTADDVTAEVLQAVRRTFVTPFDRSDIQALITALDDAIDQMNKTAKAVTLYEVTAFEPAMRELGDVIVKASAITAEALPMLRKMGKNASHLHALTEQLVRIEDHSDELYDQGMKALYKGVGRSSPMDFIIGAEIYDHLEKVVDRFEDVANVINAIVVEHV